MGSDHSKLKIVVDHFYYTDEKLEGIYQLLIFIGKLLIDTKIM